MKRRWFSFRHLSFVHSVNHLMDWSVYKKLNHCKTIIQMIISEVTISVKLKWKKGQKMAIDEITVFYSVLKTHFSKCLTHFACGKPHIVLMI